jgi:signal peptidase II
VSRRARLAILLYGFAAGAYLLDRVTKAIVEEHLAGRPPIVLIPHVVQLTYTENAGGAFSLFGGQPWLFFASSVLVGLIIVAVSVRGVATAWSSAALGLVLGGALGNLTDRIARGPGVSGRVVDFIDFHVWPVFNAADSCIVVGALILVLVGLRPASRQPAPLPDAGGERPAGP